uniref:glutamate--tRNA ligase n=1 Tax=Albugo laibachii Nc14 TaxID=890382 RepID=F0WZN7_9STRA|nr:unnamed protein product [Albugo laibachii Nc14]|eukprot:CCA26963.1 unnamed protein product [Albugo laibachii Nc14]
MSNSKKQKAKSALSAENLQAHVNSLDFSKSNEHYVLYSSQDSLQRLPVATFILSQLIPSSQQIHFQNISVIKPSTDVILVLPTREMLFGDFAIARWYARLHGSSCGIYGSVSPIHSAGSSLQAFQIDAWLDFAIRHFTSKNEYEPGLDILNQYLLERTFLVGYALSLADIAVFSLLTNRTDLESSSYGHICRWIAHLEADPCFKTAASLLRQQQPVKAPRSTASTSQKGKTSGSCPPLQGAEIGQVVTRFPPEPSGYLHIGHVKACMLNHHYARFYNGKLIVRFDDTNPSKEKEEFELSIIEDLKRLDIVPDQVSYTSDFFPRIVAYAKALIQKGLAYMDNTPQERMREERMDGIASACRDQSVEVASKLFEEMLQPSSPSAEDGYCLRAKIDMSANNKTMRDPVIFRRNLTPHHRTGTTYCAYPTYDLACPIVDSLEGVTHTLRTTEYNDRDEQYQWILSALELRKVRIHSFARMNFVYSVLSKRKLQWFVDHKHVSGWDDPRFPTVRGVLRRGVQVEALREFILSQGASRRITDMEWDKFWTLNKRVIDPKAGRYFAIQKKSAVRLKLTNIEEDVKIGLPIALHPKDPSMGEKIMRFGCDLLLEREDVEQMEEGQEVTLMRHGNIIIRKIHHTSKKDGNGEKPEVTLVEAEDFPAGDFKKTKLKVTWLADVPDLVPTQLVEFDFLLSKPKLEENDNFQDCLTPVTRAEMECLGDHALRNLKEGDVIQLERRGYFRVDRPLLSSTKPLVLFMIPDGKVKAMSTLSTNLTHR